MEKRGGHRIAQKSAHKPHALNQPGMGGRQVAGPCRRNRQTVFLVGQSELQGIAVDIGIDCMTDRLQNGIGGILAAIGNIDIGINQMAIALFRLRLKPGRKSPRAGRRAGQENRFGIPEHAAFQHGQIETAGDQPSRTDRRTDVSRNPIKIEFPVLDHFENFFAGPDAKIHSHPCESGIGELM